VREDKKTYRYESSPEGELAGVSVRRETLGEAYRAQGEQAMREDGTFVLSFYNLFWIFMVASVVGLFIETIVSYPIDGLWKDRAGLVWVPFSPIYGLGAVLMTLALNRLRSANPIFTFVVAALLGGAFEFSAGLLWESLFGIAAWDYSNQPFNLMGHTCLGIALCWGALGLMWARMLLPLTMDLIALIPTRIARPLTAIALVFMLVNIVMTLGAFNCWWERLAGLPVETPIQGFFTTYFGNEFMDARFQTITIWPDTALPRG
jgi:hypothetical protein